MGRAEEEGRGVGAFGGVGAAIGDRGEERALAREPVEQLVETRERRAEGRREQLDERAELARPRALLQCGDGGLRLLAVGERDGFGERGLVRVGAREVVVADRGEVAFTPARELVEPERALLLGKRAQAVEFRAEHRRLAEGGLAERVGRRLRERRGRVEDAGRRGGVDEPEVEESVDRARDRVGLRGRDERTDEEMVARGIGRERGGPVEESAQARRVAADRGVLDERGAQARLRAHRPEVGEEERESLRAVEFGTGIRAAEFGEFVDDAPRLVEPRAQRRVRPSREPVVAERARLLEFAEALAQQVETDARIGGVDRRKGGVLPRGALGRRRGLDEDRREQDARGGEEGADRMHAGGFHARTRRGPSPKGRARRLPVPRLILCGAYYLGTATFTAAGRGPQTTQFSIFALGCNRS